MLFRSDQESEVEVDEGILLSQEVNRMVVQEEIEWVKRDEDPREIDNHGEDPEETIIPEPQEDNDITPKATPSKYVPDLT